MDVIAVDLGGGCMLGTAFTPENILQNKDECDSAETHDEQYFGCYLVDGVHMVDDLELQKVTSRRYSRKVTDRFFLRP